MIYQGNLTTICAIKHLHVNGHQFRYPYNSPDVIWGTGKIYYLLLDPITTSNAIAPIFESKNLGAKSCIQNEAIMIHNDTNIQNKNMVISYKKNCIWLKSIKIDKSIEISHREKKKNIITNFRLQLFTSNSRVSGRAYIKWNITE